jgi:hypothetical protein
MSFDHNTTNTGIGQGGKSGGDASGIAMAGAGSMGSSTGGVSGYNASHSGDASGGFMGSSASAMSGGDVTDNTSIGSININS